MVTLVLKAVDFASKPIAVITSICPKPFDTSYKERVVSCRPVSYMGSVRFFMKRAMSEDASETMVY